MIFGYDLFCSKKQVKEGDNRYLQVAGSGDEEPLVDRRVDGGSGLGSSGGDVLDNLVLGTSEVRASLNRDVAPKGVEYKTRKEHE